MEQGSGGDRLYQQSTRWRENTYTELAELQSQGCCQTVRAQCRCEGVDAVTDVCPAPLGGDNSH